MFDHRQVLAAIRARVPDIHACYEHVIRSEGVEGKITLELTIDESGAVSRVEVVENTSDSDRLAGCLLRHVRGLQLTRGPDHGPVRLRYPFVFRAQR